MPPPPRRYGKTSLVKRVQAGLENEGFLACYTDLFMVTGVEEVARRTTDLLKKVFGR